MATVLTAPLGSGATPSTEFPGWIVPAPLGRTATAQIRLAQLAHVAAGLSTPPTALVRAGAVVVQRTNSTFFAPFPECWPSATVGHRLDAPAVSAALWSPRSATKRPAPVADALYSTIARHPATLPDLAANTAPVPTPAFADNPGKLAVLATALSQATRRSARQARPRQVSSSRRTNPKIRTHGVERSQPRTRANVLVGNDVLELGWLPRAFLEPR